MEIFPFKTSHDGTTFERNLTYDEANEVRKFIRLLEQGRAATPQKQIAVQGTIEDYTTPAFNAVVDMSTEEGPFIYACWKKVKEKYSRSELFEMGDLTDQVSESVEGRVRPGNLLPQQSWWKYFLESEKVPRKRKKDGSEYHTKKWRVREDKAEEFQSFQLGKIQ